MKMNENFILANRMIDESVSSRYYLTNCRSTHTASTGSKSAPVGLPDLGLKIPAATAVEVEVAVAVALAEETLDLVILGDGADDDDEGGAEEDELPIKSVCRIVFRCLMTAARPFPSLSNRCTSLSVAALACTKLK